MREEGWGPPAAGCTRVLVQSHPRHCMTLSESFRLCLQAWRGHGVSADCAQRGPIACLGPKACEQHRLTLRPPPSFWDPSVPRRREGGRGGPVTEGCNVVSRRGEWGARSGGVRVEAQSGQLALAPQMRV